MDNVTALVTVNIVIYLCHTTFKNNRFTSELKQVIKNNRTNSNNIENRMNQNNFHQILFRIKINDEENKRNIPRTYHEKIYKI